MYWPRIGTKRALSEIPTAAVLLAGVTMMGLFLVAWSNTSLSTNQVELDATFSNKVNKLTEEIVVEKVWFGTDSNSKKFINMTLSNTSSLGLSITEVEFVNSTDTITFSASDDVLPDQVFSIEEFYDWSSGESVDVIVTTARGNIFTVQVLPQ